MFNSHIFHSIIAFFEYLEIYKIVDPHGSSRIHDQNQSAAAAPWWNRLVRLDSRRYWKHGSGRTSSSHSPIGSSMLTPFLANLAMLSSSVRNKDFFSFFKLHGGLFFRCLNRFLICGISSLFWTSHSYFLFKAPRTLWYHEQSIH